MNSSPMVSAGPVSENPFQIALKTVAPLAVNFFVSEIDANRAAIEARITNVEVSAIDRVRDAMLGAVPSGGLLSTLFKPEADAAINKLSAELVSNVGGEVNALINLAELEMRNFVARISS